MHPLQFSSSNLSETKQKAIHDARTAQALVLRECVEAQRDPPPYRLLELIGKGSFGRVYKASANKPGQLVAVKIISIEEGDDYQRGTADTLGDILKEVNTLKLLSNSGARNVNAVVDTRLVGQSVWVVTEYCAGGSVASLMRPTSGLAERWIIPVLREVAEALYWVHKQGIIHRDIKCANVLVTEAGGVQLCDFGVAGIMETKFDKRSTVTGTLHWMAPELFDSNVSYGIEVDIWAFGSMAFEIANGLPPNATARIQIQEFGSYLKQNRTRLQGDKFSDQLKHLISFCLIEDPKKRPPIEEIQRHPYIFKTEDKYPTVSLAKLVADYKRWESQGGSRKSLFSAGGAQGLAMDRSPSRQSGWDFGDYDYDKSDELTLQRPEVAHSAVHHGSTSSADATMLPSERRRRRPPPNMAKLKGPLEKVFDPNTITNYEDNSRAWYGRMVMAPVTDPPPKTEPPSKDKETEQPAAARESLIDLDFAMDGDATSPTIEMETLRPVVRPLSTDFVEYDNTDRPKTQDWSFPSTKRKTQEWSFPSNNDTSNDDDNNNTIDNRKTQEWKFPTVMPASAPADMDRFSDGGDEFLNLDVHSTGGYQYDDSSTVSQPFQPTRESTLSLIDLDASLASDMSYHNNNNNNSGSPSSPGSAPGSVAFDLELDTQSLANTTREPSLYIDDDMDSIPSLTRQLSDLQSTPTTPDERSDITWEPSGLGILSNNEHQQQQQQQEEEEEEEEAETEGYQTAAPALALSLPPIPGAPSANILQGMGSREDLKHELQNMISSLREHLQYANDWLDAYDTQHSEQEEE